MRHQRRKEPFQRSAEKLMVDMRHARNSLLEMHLELTPYKNEYFDTCTAVIFEIDKLAVKFGFPEDHFHAKAHSPVSYSDDA